MCYVTFSNKKGNSHFPEKSPHKVGYLFLTLLQFFWHNLTYFLFYVAIKCVIKLRKQATEIAAFTTIVFIAHVEEQCQYQPLWSRFNLY